MIWQLLKFGISKQTANIHSACFTYFFLIDTQAIRYLKLENIFIGVAEIRDIAGALLENTAIIILLLFFHIIIFLSSLQTLIVMNLWNNQIGDEGAEHLVNVLKQIMVIFIHSTIGFDTSNQLYIETHHFGLMQKLNWTCWCTTFGKCLRR